MLVLKQHEALLRCACPHMLIACSQDAFKYLHLSERGYKALGYCLYPRLKQLLGPHVMYGLPTPPSPCFMSCFVCWICSTAGFFFFANHTR